MEPAHKASLSSHGWSTCSAHKMKYTTATPKAQVRTTQKHLRVLGLRHTQPSVKLFSALFLEFQHLAWSFSGTRLVFGMRRVDNNNKNKYIYNHTLTNNTINNDINFPALVYLPILFPVHRKNIFTFSFFCWCISFNQNCFTLLKWVKSIN